MHLSFPFGVLTHVSLLFSLSFLVEAEGSDGRRLRNGTVQLLSPWLKEKVGDDDLHGFRPREKHDCSGKKLLCGKKEDGLPGKMKCCKNRCVDVSSDVNNCGFCGKRCSFPRQCCRGFCIDTNNNRFNCGKCGNKCTFRVRCVYGMCGYGQPDPRWPPKDPHPPHPPKDPHPPQPPKDPHPPHPPKDPHPPHPPKDPHQPHPPKDPHPPAVDHHPSSSA